MSNPQSIFQLVIPQGGSIAIADATPGRLLVSTIEGRIIASDSPSLTGDLSLTGNLTVNGNAVLGDTVTDSHTVSGDVSISGDGAALLVQVSGTEIARITSTGLGLFGAPAFELDVTKAKSGGDVRFLLFNTSNTASSTATVQIASGGGSAGDPKVLLTIDLLQNWGVGIDNSDADKFKISAGGNLGTNDFLTITVAGEVAIPTLGGGGGAISVGAVDSGGAGFRQLRVPN